MDVQMTVLVYQDAEDPGYNSPGFCHSHGMVQAYANREWLGNDTA